MKIVILFLIVIATLFNCTSSSVSVTSNGNISPNANLTKNVGANEEAANSDKTNKAAISSLEIDKKKYIGCWGGSGGGRLKVTENVIYDLGSKERASFETLPVVERKEKEKLDESLLKTDKNFKLSFLNKFILIRFKSDEFAYIFSYESYEDYVNDKFSGAGEFIKVACKEIE